MTVVRPSQKKRKVAGASLLGVFGAQRTNKQKGDNALGLMCGIDQLPMSIVNGVGFKMFCNAVAPTHQVPVNDTVATWVEAIAAHFKLKVDCASV